MISNAPLVGPKALKRRLWRDYPEDMRPSRLSAALAHFGTVQEFGWPLLLITVDNEVVRTIAIVGMILFHLNITSMFPLAVPLEWNVFMIFGMLFLFGHYGDVPLSSLDDPLLIAMIAIVCVGLPVLGNFRPDKISFLPSMRYYAGNWATTQWLFRKGSGAEEKLDTHIDKPAPLVGEQVTPTSTTTRSWPTTCSTRGSASARCTRTGAPSTPCCPTRSTTSRPTTPARAS